MKAGVALPCLLLTRLLIRRSVAVRALAPLALAAALCLPLCAQTSKTITILMLDGKTGKPIIPSNFQVRLDHLNAVQNEAVRINDEGLGTAKVPDSATLFSVQATHSGSMEVYVNCDAAMQKDVHTLHWYSVADILATGVNTPNECYRGKYDKATRLAPKPGVFVFYVRKSNWHELSSD